MAKKSPTLTFRDIVLGADADTIRRAHEARVKIDQLMDERQKAYERIASLETQVENVIGEPGVFPFPAPPLPIAGFDAKAEFVTRAGGAAKKPASSPLAPDHGSAPAGDDDDDGHDGETDSTAATPPAPPVAKAPVPPLTPPPVRKP